MNEQALFCDGTAEYVKPAEPEINARITLRFRTAKDDIDAVRLLTGESRYPMYKAETKGEFDYYEIRWRLGEESFSYCFEIIKDQERCYYNRCGVSRNIVDFYAFTIVPGFSTPDWAKGAVMYQIFVDRFYNGDPSNDVEDREYVYIGAPVQKVKDWYELPQATDIRRFYGGDLQGVREKLDYLQELGIEGIYFNPLFVSPSNHKYDSQDYDYIDPHFGKIVADGGEVLTEDAATNGEATRYQQRICDEANLEASNQLFAELVEEMHRRGMRVLIDGVFNHCGSFHKWMDKEGIYAKYGGFEKGAFANADSPYSSFFHFFDEGGAAGSYHEKYDGWWGHDTLPKLNYEDSLALENYVMQIGRKWVSPPYNVDGWRLDVAADLGYTNEYNHIFWKRFRKEVKEANPEALILAEHYGDPADWLRGDEWDSVMNYDAFMEPVTWFLTGMEKHSDERREDLCGNADNFVNSMNHFMACMLTPSLQVAMNELSNHDHSRFLTRTNHMVGRLDSLGAKAAEDGVNKAVMRLAVVLQMTWVGAPTVYYGDEAGLCGFTDPDNRRAYPWGREDKELLQFHKDIIQIHREEEALRIGSLLMLSWKDDILAYARFKGDSHIIVALNNSEIVQEVTIPVWRAEVSPKGRMKRIFCAYEDGYNMDYDEYIVEDGEIVMNIGAHSAVILKDL